MTDRKGRIKFFKAKITFVKIEIEEMMDLLTKPLVFDDADLTFMKNIGNLAAKLEHYNGCLYRIENGIKAPGLGYDKYADRLGSNDISRRTI